MDIKIVIEDYFKEQEMLENRYYDERDNLLLRLEILKNNGKSELIIKNKIDKLDKEYSQAMKKLELKRQEIINNLVNINSDLEKELIRISNDNDKLTEQLSNFKYIYNNEGLIINDKEYKKLFNSCCNLIKQRNKIENDLLEIKNYLSLLEEGPKEIISDSDYNETLEDANENEYEEDVYFIDEVEIFDNRHELLSMIYNDIINLIKKKRSIKLVENKKGHFLVSKDKKGELVEVDGELNIEKPMKLPNGQYLYKKDIVSAFKKYVSQNKGRTFTIIDIDKTIVVTANAIRVLQRYLKDCSIIKLMKERKLSFTDIKRVYGKEKADDYSNKAQIGKIESSISSGEYINVTDFAECLDEIFMEKGQNWIEKIKELYIEAKYLYLYGDSDIDDEIEIDNNVFKK